MQNGFRLRGLKDVSRVEAPADGVFAFAITLLVVSLEVPRTFDQLLVMMRGLFAGLICWLIGPIQYVHGRRRDKTRRKLEAQVSGSELSHAEAGL